MGKKKGRKEKDQDLEDVEVLPEDYTVADSVTTFDSRFDGTGKNPRAYSNPLLYSQRNQSLKRTMTSVMTLMIIYIVSKVEILPRPRQPCGSLA